MEMEKDVDQPSNVSEAFDILKIVPKKSITIHNEDEDVFVSGEHIDFGRGSFGLGWELLGFGRESSGFRRESCGRESLGILSTTAMNEKLASADLLSFSPFKASCKEVFSLVDKEKSTATNFLSSLSTILEVEKDNGIGRVICESENSKPCTTNDETAIDNFGESVFIEAKVMASKIADGSILEEKGEMGRLDSTTQPEWGYECNEQSIGNTVVSEDIIKNNEENMGSPQINCDNINLSNGMSPNSTNHIETVQNLSKIFQNKSLSLSRVSCSSNKSTSKDTKEILENLSDILSTENPTLEQKSEGQNLLYNLADILYNSRTSSKKESSDDSSHCSIENDLEINRSPNSLDLSIKSTSCNNPSKPLDLAVTQIKKELTRSNTCPESREKPKTVPKVLQTRQVNIPGSIKSLGKLKPKKIEDKKKGPLKAILPLGNMSKVFNRQNKENSTPPRRESSSYGNRQTSTPKMFPVAESTPDEIKNKQKAKEVSPSHLPKPKFNCPVSPLARPNKSREIVANGKTMQRTLTDSLLTKLKQSSSTSLMSRRKSSSDIKSQTSSAVTKNNSDVKPLQLKRSNSTSSTEIKPPLFRSGLKRSNSISNDMKPSATFNSEKNKASNLAEKNRGKIPGIKSINLMSKFKRSTGKENLPK